LLPTTHPPHLCNGGKRLGAKFGADSPEYVALKTLTGQTLLDRVKVESGLAFTEAELKMRRELMPEESDTLARAIAKTAALTALNTTTANTRLQGLDATDHDTAGLRRLFKLGGADLPDIPASEAQAILNMLPAEMRKNSDVMNQFVDVLPPGMRNAVDDILKNAGTPRSGSFGRQLKEKFGVGN
jgi:hypothetical protein